MFRLKDRVFYGWFIVISLFVILGIVLGIRYSFGVFLKSIEDEFVLSRGGVSGIYSVYLLLCGLFAFLGGMALDRYGPRLVFLSLGIFTGLSLILTSTVHQTWQLFFTYSLLLSLGTGAVFSIVAVTVSKWFVKNRGLALGITLSGEGAGLFIMSPIAASLILAYGWREAFFVLAIIAIVFICGLSFVLKRSPSETVSSSNLETGQLKGTGSSQKTATIPLKSVSLSEAVKTNSFWLVILIQVFSSFSLNSILTHLVPSVTDFNIDTATAATAMSVLGLSIIPGRFIMGWISDRINRKALCVLFSFLQVLIMLWLAWSHNLWMFYLFAVIYGFTMGGLNTVFYVLMGEMFGAAYLGAIAGASIIGFGIAAAIGPYVGGLMYDIYGNYFAFYLINALSMLVVLILFALTRKEVKA